MTCSYRIRGIYSTAISIMISNHGHELVDSSKLLKERLKLPESKLLVSNANIFDDSLRLGIFCVGESQSVNIFENILKKSLNSPIILKPIFNKDVLIHGRILDIKYNSLLVDLPGNFQGEVRFNKKSFSVGEEILVSTISSYYSRDQKNLVKLTTSLRFKGDMIEFLINYSDFELNKYFENKRYVELSQFNHLLHSLPNRTKLVINRNFLNISTEELIRDINKSIKKINEIFTIYDKSEALEILYENYSSLQCIFTPQNKIEMDLLRSKIVYTLNNHHFYRSLGEYTSNQLDMLEKLIETKSLTEEESTNFIKNYYLDKLRLSNNLKLIHIKPNGKVITLGSPTIEEFSSTHLILKRIVKSDGIYDGLNIPKNINDIILTKIDFSDLNFIKHQYFDKNYVLKGDYWNINAPVECGIDFIRYIDLILDIVHLPGKKPVIIDQEELDNFVRQKIISEELNNEIYKIADKILRIIENSMKNT